MTFDLSDIATYREIARAATPGPWLDGNWFWFCKKNHAHDSRNTGKDACAPKAFFSPGGRLICAGTPADPTHVVSNDEFDGATISAADKLHIVTFNPAFALELLDVLSSFLVPTEIDEPQQRHRSKAVKSLLKKVVCKDATEIEAVREAGLYILELEERVRSLTTKLGAQNA